MAKENSDKDRLWKYLMDCQAQAQNLDYRLQGIGVLLQNFNPELEVDNNQLNGVGDLLMDLAEKARQLGTALDFVTVGRVERGEQ